MALPRSTVYIHGAQSMTKLDDVLAYELLDLKAGTYHKFLSAGNIAVYLNDFGIKSVTVVPAGTKEYDIPHI